MTTTDPEYDRAGEEMQRLFDVARKMADEKHPAVLAYAEECRTRSTPPDPVPLRVEPPEEHARQHFHWLMLGELAVPAMWWPDSKFWSLCADAEEHSPCRLAEGGYTYASPCKPDTRTEKEKAAVAELMESQGLTEAQVMRQALRHYQAHVHRLLDGETCTWSGDAARAEEFAGNAPSRIEPTDEAIDPFFWEFSGGMEDHIPWRMMYPQGARKFAREILAHFSPTQTITPVEPEITDAEILKLGHKLFCYIGDDSNNCADIIEFARALLARHTPTSISNSTLDHIQSIAKTREPEQFRNECRDMLRGGG